MGVDFVMTTSGIFASPVKNGAAVNLFEEVSEHEKYVHFVYDPLAIVVELSEQGKAAWEIAEVLRTKTSNNSQPSGKAREQADAIRKYYRNKLMVLGLKNQSMSQFRRDLQDFVDRKEENYVKEQELRMIVKLPEFYREDRALEDIAKRFRFGIDDYKKSTSLVNTDITLRPINKIHRKTKQCNLMQYYFANKDRDVFRIDIQGDNPLLHLFEKAIDQEEITVNACTNAQSIRGTEYAYYHVFNWQLV